MSQTNSTRPWDRRSAETVKAYAAFRFYCELGARRSVREAARQNNIKTTSLSEKHTRVNTTVRRWLGWSAKHRWVSRAAARDAWIAQVEDEQIVINIKACMLALTETALKLLKTGDSSDFLRAARALSLHFPPIQRMEDVSERFEDLSDLTDDQLERMTEIRDEERLENAAKAQEATGQIHEQPN